MKLQAGIVITWCSCLGLLVFTILRINPNLISNTAGLGTFHVHAAEFVPAKPVLEIFSNQKTIAQFRNGPQRTGAQSGYLEPDLGPAEIFETLNVGIHSASKSSPIADETGIYLGADTGWFFAFDWRGKRTWRFQVMQASQGIHSSASVDQDSVYFGAYNGRFYRLNKADGRPRWTQYLGSAIGSSPLLAEEKVFVSVELSGPKNGFVVALDRASGKRLWRSQNLGAQIHSSPTLCDASPPILVVGVNNQDVVGLDPVTGQVRWRTKVKGAVKGTLPSTQDLVFGADEGGSLSAITCARGEIAWQKDLGFRSGSSPTLISELKIVVVGGRDGFLQAYDHSDGKTRWKTNLDQMGYRGSATFVKSKSIPGGLLWTGCREKYLCAISALNGTIVGTWYLGAAISSVPVIFGSRICVSTEDPGNLICFEAR